MDQSKPAWLVALLHYLIAGLASSIVASLALFYIMPFLIEAAATTTEITLAGAAISALLTFAATALSALILQRSFRALEPKRIAFIATAYHLLLSALLALAYYYMLASMPLTSVFAVSAAATAFAFALVNGGILYGASRLLIKRKPLVP